MPSTIYRKTIFALSRLQPEISPICGCFFRGLKAKEVGLAGCLVQYPNNNVDAKCKPIGFCSRGLQKHEKNYSAHLIETAVIIFAIEFFEKYLRTKFVCHTDHKPITTVKEGKVHKRTLERFRKILANYDFTLEYTPGEQMPSDFMSRHNF